MANTLFTAALLFTVFSSVSSILYSPIDGGIPILLTTWPYEDAVRAG